MRRTNMLVLMMGRAPEHAITSFLHFLPKHVVLITTPTFASTYRRRLPHWAKRYDFDGWVETIPEPFTHDAPAEITEVMAGILTTQRFMEALGSAEPGDAKGIEMGLTGGTTLMSALVASLAGMIPLVRTHYVVRPEEGRAVSPTRRHTTSLNPHLRGAQGRSSPNHGLHSASSHGRQRRRRGSEQMALRSREDVAERSGRTDSSRLGALRS